MARRGVDASRVSVLLTTTEPSVRISCVTEGERLPLLFMSSCAWCEAHFLSVNKMQRGTARREGGAAYGQARQDRLNKAAG
jgi:hypothetical protein